MTDSDTAAEQTPEPRVSVIVCVYNRPAQVVACLDSLRAAAGADVELIVVDDGSTDDTPEVVTAYAREHPTCAIRLVRNERNLGVSGARNAGLRAARGRYVLFTDSDCTVEADWINRLVEAMESTEAVAAAGAVVDRTPRNIAERAAWGTTRIDRTSWQRRRLVGNNMGFRRDVVLRHMFDESLTYGCDEDELAWRLERDGHRIVYAPQAVVHHDHPMTIRSFLRQALRQGVGSARYWYKRGIYLGRDLWLLTAALMTLPLCLWKPALWPLPVSLLGLHVFALLMNETVLKGKRVCDALVALPLLVLYSLCKAGSVYRTLVKIFLGADPAIRRSKRAMTARSG